jgi:TPR repeat protein
MDFSVLRRWFTPADARNLEITQPPEDLTEVETQFLKGLKFASGEGIAQDYAQAADWYGRAAEQNHGLAQFNLAMMYGQGQGVPRDEVKSLMWMTRAAKLGDAAAQYKLGVHQHLVCREGQPAAAAEGRIEALKWVQLSAAQGYRGAKGACEFVALDMTREEVVEGGRRASAFVAQKSADAP